MNWHVLVFLHLQVVEQAWDLFDVEVLKAFLWDNLWKRNGYWGTVYLALVQGFLCGVDAEIALIYWNTSVLIYLDSI